MLLRLLPRLLCCSLQIDKEGPSLKIIPSQLVKNGEVKLVPTYSLHAYELVCMVPEDILHATSEATNFSIYHGD